MNVMHSGLNHKNTKQEKFGTSFLRGCNTALKSFSLQLLAKKCLSEFYAQDCNVKGIIRL